MPSSQIIAPHVEWAALVPLLFVFGGAIIGVLIEAFVPRRARRVSQIVISLVAIAGAAISFAWRSRVVLTDGPREIVGGSLIEDGPTLAFQGVILIAGILAFLVFADRNETKEGAFAPQVAARPGSPEETTASRLGWTQTELFPLALFSLGGMLVFPAAGDLLTLFVALEVLSLPLYVLSASARRRRLLSQEAALKYFLLGAFSSAFFIFGIALLYGYSGSVRLSQVATAAQVNFSSDTLLLAGITLVMIGLLFKIGAAPFHSWTPDVYQGAPTPVTGFMAAGTKTAAFAALVRLLWAVVPQLKWDLSPLMWTVIILTMLVGTVVGIVQTDIKRMLAYSSIAHAGFILIGVISLSDKGIAAIVFYLLAYGIATVGAFTIITLVHERDASGAVMAEATHISQWAGLGRRAPGMAVAMTVFLISFAGLPLTAGFIGKFTVFAAGIDGGGAPLVILAVLASAATAFFYVRIIVLMFFTEPDGEATAVVLSEGLSTVVIGVCAVATIVMGVLPGPVFDLLERAMVYLP